MLRLFLGLLTALPVQANQEASLQREAYLMGTTLRIAVAAPDTIDLAGAIEGAFRQVTLWEDRLSTWRSGTELSRLNDATPGTPVPLSRAVADALLEVRRWTRETEGAFDPAIGALIDAWQLRGSGATPAPETIDSALAASGIESLALDSAAGTATRLRPDVWLDGGGFGKGLALRAAARTLQSAQVSGAVLDFGGQVMVLGVPPAGHPWAVAVAHPERRKEPVLMLRLKPGQSAATTAISARHVESGGRTLGHVVDPRTGQPVAAWGSVTLVADDPLVADVLSTALFVMGAQEALDWAGRHPDIGVVVVGSAAGKPRWSASLDDAVSVIDSDDGEGGP